MKKMKTKRIKISIEEHILQNKIWLKGKSRKNGRTYIIYVDEFKKLMWDFDNSDLSVRKIAEKYKFPHVMLVSKLKRMGFRRSKKTIHKVFKTRPQCHLSGDTHHLTGTNHPRWGVNHPSYKHGKFCKDNNFYCVDCGVPINIYHTSIPKQNRCKKCFLRRRDAKGRLIK